MKKALLQLHSAVFLWGFTGVLGRLITLGETWLVWWRLLITAVLFGFFIISPKELENYLLLLYCILDL
jgi:hypothetical protein